MTSIGVIGAGAIVEGAHLPAYRRAGFEVAAIADVRAERAAAIAREFGIPRALGDPYELIELDVGVIDIAVPAAAQPELALAVVAAGKPLLCQKPLALTMAEAARVVEAAEAAGVSLAVNQQMRWSPLIRRVKDAVAAGDIGEPERLAFDVSIDTDFSQWEFLRTTLRLEFLYHSIHYFDAARHLLGEPSRLTAWAGASPGRATVGETRTITVLEFPAALATISSDHNDRATPLHRAELRVVGSEGTILGEIGLLYDYPHGRPDRIRIVRSGSDAGVDETLPGDWFPDAFIGPMSELLAAASGGPAPSTNGRDNLRTLALVLAAYESVERSAAVDIDRWLDQQVGSVGLGAGVNDPSRHG
jgi:predicted dehydrogenase